MTHPQVAAALSAQQREAEYNNYYMGYDTVERVNAYAEVEANYTLPFPLYPFQKDTVDLLAHRPAAGYYLDMGIGKTATSTVAVLYKMLHGVEQCLVLMPPILITNWYRFLKQFPEISVCAYRGAPKDRMQMRLTEKFILMSYQIFKQDFDRLVEATAGKRLAMILDEAAAIKNPSTANYRKFKEFYPGHDVLLLTGTPLSSPIDGYVYIKTCAPNIYRNFRMYENLHVGDRDFFGQVTSWKNLDLLANNLRVNAVRILKEDVLKDLPEITYTPMYYELAPDHQKLYTRLAEEQLLKLKDGSKIDATQATALYHALQQIICNYDHFSGDSDKTSVALDLLEETLEETEKLVVFTNYRMTNQMLTERLKKYNAVFLWGGVSDKVQRDAIDTFVSDPACRVIVMNVTAGGVGIDRLQHVCQNVLFLEIPTVPTQFHQACARVHRVGQKNNVNVRIAVAEKTCMPRLFNNLMHKDSLVNMVVRGTQDLRDAIFGG